MANSFDQALQAYKQGQYQEAVPQFLQLVSQYPQDAKLRMWLAAAYREAGQIEEAKQQFQEVLKLTTDPKLIDLARTSLAKLAKATSPQVSSQANGNAVAASHVLQNGNGSSHSNGNHTKVASLSEIDPDAATNQANGNPKSLGKLPKHSGSTSASLSQPLSGFPDDLPEAVVPQPQPSKSTKPKEQRSPAPKQPRHTPEKSRVSLLKRLSLRTKVAALAIALGTIPVIGIGAVAYFFADQAVVKQIKQDKQDRVITLADETNRFMSERYADVVAISRLPIFTVPKVSNITSLDTKKAVLDDYIEALKAYDSIAVFDTKGDVIVQSKGEKLYNHSDRAYFQEALKTGKAVISSPQVSQTSGKFGIYFAAPIRDQATKQIIGVVRMRMPVQAISDLLQKFGASGDDYHLIDADGKIFVDRNNEEIGKETQASFPFFNQLNASNQVTTRIATDTTTGKTRIVSYAPFTPMEGIPDLNWDAVVARDAAIAFQPQFQLLVTLATGTGIAALLVGAIAVWLTNRAIRPILSAADTVEQLGQGDLTARTHISGQDELATLGTNINLMADQLQSLLEKQVAETQRVQLLAEITAQIRQSLNLDAILQTTVEAVQKGLDTSRVMIYRFDENWDGVVIAESVDPRWTETRGIKLVDTCLKDNQGGSYRNGQVRAIADIYDAGLTPCHIKMLERFDVKANLVAPILVNEKLFGLLIAHHCSAARDWGQSETELFAQLSTQVGIALEQAQLLEQIEQARQQAETTSQEQRQQKESLQMQLIGLLSDVEGASRGDLTVRADVTAGDIGTVADFFNAIIESLRRIVTQVKTTAGQVNTSVGENEHAIRQLAEVALKQADEIAHTLNSVEQMTQSIQAVATSAHQAADVARQASTTAETGGVAMDKTVRSILSLRETVANTAKKVKRLGESSQQISKVVSLINQIALQTNLLAINASIEAARAGEEGRGFAVVAEEVGELAAQSAAATKDIEQIVENIQLETSEVVQAMELGTTQVVEGTHLVEDAKHSLSQILAVSRHIDQLVRSISDATVSQAQTSQSVTQLMQQLAQASQHTSEASRQVSSSLSQTVTVTQQLQESVDTFKVGTEV